jgi:hypothetical protein
VVEGGLFSFAVWDERRRDMMLGCLVSEGSRWSLVTKLRGGGETETTPLLIDGPGKQPSATPCAEGVFVRIVGMMRSENVLGTKAGLVTLGADEQGPTAIEWHESEKRLVGTSYDGFWVWEDQRWSRIGTVANGDGLAFDPERGLVRVAGGVLVRFTPRGSTSRTWSVPTSARSSCAIESVKRCCSSAAKTSSGAVARPVRRRSFSREEGRCWSLLRSIASECPAVATVPVVSCAGASRS